MTTPAKKAYMKAYSHARYLRNRDKILAQNKIWRKNNLVKTRALARRNGTGWTHEEYEATKLEQKNRCAICHRERPLCGDHNEETKQKRGLLCRQCNAAIGLLSHDTTIIQSAIDYLTWWFPQS